MQAGRAVRARAARLRARAARLRAAQVARVEV